MLFATMIVAQIAKLDLEIQTTIQNYLEATRTYNVQALQKLLHPTYFEVSPRGELDVRARVISFYDLPAGSPKSAPSSIETKDWHIQYPSKGHANAHLTEVFTIKGPAQQVNTMTVKATYNLKKEKSGWQLCMMQVVALPPKPRT